MSEEKPPAGCYVALGCAGAVLVALMIMFGSLYYFGFVQRGGVYDGLRAQLAQGQLNQLVPYVEMYRTQRGVYPESLDQVAPLIPSNVPVGIHDASSMAVDRIHHYERVGGANYILRSVGADGVPFTSDDIVPDGFPNGGVGLLLERPAATSSGTETTPPTSLEEPEEATPP
jgi:hypothetical protein